MVEIRPCAFEDANQLAQMNRMLIEDEHAENAMSAEELKQRMEGFLKTGYKAFFFAVHGDIAGYALVHMERQPLYLRQFLICREERRKGYGKEAFHALLHTLKADEMDVDVLSWNEAGLSFWRSLGFVERVLNMRLKR